MTKILIVEDLSETRRWLSEIVSAAFEQSEIHEAASMRAGIAQAAARDYDVALIDLGLPHPLADRLRGGYPALHNPGCRWGLNPPVSSRLRAM